MDPAVPVGLRPAAGRRLARETLTRLHSGPLLGPGSRGASRWAASLRCLLRAGAFTVAAAGAARLHAAVDPGVLCPLRRLTGIPCPLCGSTTVFLELGSGDIRGALAANPVTALAAAALTFAPLGAGRWWWDAPPRWRGCLVGGALTSAWCWQLGRFDLLPV
ncbi:MAG: DUF2752 domain-containing protein [Carbonactinosporaceae bacterium]